MPTLEDAVGALLGIPIHYYARIDFRGFIKMVDAVGGVDIDVAHGFSDPGYDGYGAGDEGLLDHGRPASLRRRRGARLRPLAQGARRERLHPAGAPAADPRRPARSRRPAAAACSSSSPSCSTRSARRSAPTSRSTASRSSPRSCDEVGRDDLTSVVIRAPLVKSKSTRYGDSQEPDLAAIPAVAAGLFSQPGTDPTPWPTPKPTKAPKAKASPTPRPTS